MDPIAPARLRAHVNALSVGIGVRLAGTPGESEAARYIEEAFQRAGACVHTESFAVSSLAVKSQSLEVLIGGRWRRFPCSLFSSTPGTGGRTVEAPLVFFEAPAAGRRTDLRALRGKAVVHLGCHIESRAAYRRLIEARPAFLLFVDVRYPGPTPLADGMFPAYTRAIGAVPVVNVAYMDTWTWAGRGAEAARLCVDGGMRPGRSQNVVAELPGADPAAGVLYFGAHHDTQADSPGADDNAAGVAGVLELARVLAPLPRRRAIRLISFGAEEQLSVGSAEYVRAHRAEVARQGRLMVNLDSYGSLMGWTELVCNGPARLERAALQAFTRHGLDVKILNGIVPYADHFPFVAAGIPGLYLGRANCAGGRFFHHRPDDDISRLSFPLMARHLDAVSDFVGTLSRAKQLPFPVAIPAAQAEGVKTFWEDLFGGWTPRLTKGAPRGRRPGPRPAR